MIVAAPDALTTVLPNSRLAPFAEDDLAELVVLQRCCWVQEMLLNDTTDIPALRETHEQVQTWAQAWTTLVVRRHRRLVAAVRGRVEAEQTRWQVGRLMVAPDLTGRGLGSALLKVIEAEAPASTREFVLFTGRRSQANIRLYERGGYRLAPLPDPMPPGHIGDAVYLVKPAL